MLKTSSLTVLMLLFVSSSLIFTYITAANNGNNDGSTTTTTESTTTATTEPTTTTTIEETTTTTTSLPEETTTTTTQQPICSLSANDISFSGMVPDSTSPSNVISTVTNTGDMVITSILIRGQDWQKVGGGTPIAVSETRWSTINYLDYDSMTQLTTYDQAVSMTPLGTEDSDDILFRLRVPSDQPAGDYTQQITLTFGCSQL